MVVRNEYPLATILPMSGYQLSATGGTGEYTWNEGGMLRSDSARGITDIEYHPMGQPQKVTFADGGYLYYTYRADGTLASVKTYSVLPGASKPTQVSARSYCGNFVFENDSLTTVNFSGGYFDGKGAPHYRHADFQGNITIVTDQDGDIEQHTGYYPYGEPWREHDGQPYLYGYKERMRDNGLNYNDFTARRLNAVTCLWSTPDPLALDYSALSPYSSCAANPVRFIDPSGRKIQGVKQSDIEHFLNQVKIVLANQKFEPFLNALEISGKQLKISKTADIESILSNIEMTEDEKCFVSTLIETIKDKKKAKVEYVDDKEEPSEEGKQNILARETIPISTVNKIFVEKRYGGALTVKTNGNNSYSVMLMSVKDGETNFLTYNTFHEVLGHGLSNLKGLKEKQNKENAIRMENLVRRIMGMDNQRREHNHDGSIIESPTSLPDYSKKK